MDEFTTVPARMITPSSATMETWFPLGAEQHHRAEQAIGRISMIAIGSANELNWVARMK